MHKKYPKVDNLNKDKVNNHYLECTKNIFTLQNNRNNYKQIPVEIKQQRRGINNSENSLIQGGLNFISPKITKGHFRSYSIIDNGKYRENYIQNVNSLRESLESPSKVNKSLSKGLKYNEIPRINMNKNSSNYRINHLHNSIEKSFMIAQDSLNGEVSLVDKENDRLNCYMKNLNFLNFKNEDEQKVGKYPSIIDFQNMEKMRYHKLKVTGNKFMGKKYGY